MRLSSRRPLGPRYRLPVVAVVSAAALHTLARDDLRARRPGGRRRPYRQTKQARAGRQVGLFLLVPCESAGEAVEDCWIAAERERDPCPSSVVVLDPSWESLAVPRLHSGSSREELGSVPLPRNVTS